MDRRTLNLGILAAAALPWLPARAWALDLEAALSPRVMGDPDAPVTMLEFASMTCPHCASFHVNTLDEIRTTYIDTGKVKLEMRDFPLDRYALMASAMARAAPEDRYFGLVDLLFKQQAKWTRGDGNQIAENLVQIGRFAGIKEEDAIEAMTSQALADGILEIRLAAQKEFEITSTPTFVINGTKVSGAQNFSDFKDVIEDKLG